MKILLVSLFLPQEKAYHAGGRFVFEMIRIFSARHEICLATRLEEKELPGIESLRPFCKEIYPYTYRTGGRRGLFDVISLIANYLGFSRYADRLARDGNFDLIQVEWVEAGVLIKKRGTPMVLDAHDVITKPAERYMKACKGVGKALGYLRYLFVRSLEYRTVKKFNIVFARSENDRDYVLSMKPDLNVKVIPHPAGLDITDRTIDKQQNTILFLASYKYRKVNVDAALFFYREVFPLVRARIPEARFIAAGYGPPDELTSLAAKDPAFIVPGFVKNIDECYKKASVFVAPILTGGGIIVKILDALAAGTPTVATTFGNEGIGAVPERDLLIADDPERFAEAVVKLLTNREYAIEIGEHGKKFVRQEYGIESVIAKHEAAYDELFRKVS